LDLLRWKKIPGRTDAARQQQKKRKVGGKERRRKGGDSKLVTTGNIAKETQSQETAGKRAL